jgi:hypothetical protein
MNYISGRHQEIASWICEPEVLTNPENYFGPNYKTILNFWIYWWGLTKEQRYECWLNYLNTDFSFRTSSEHYSELLARQVADRRIVDHLRGYECEILVAHKILESGKSLVFLPLLENL